MSVINNYADSEMKQTYLT